MSSSRQSPISEKDVEAYPMQDLGLFPPNPQQSENVFVQVPELRRPGLLGRLLWTTIQVWGNLIDELNFPRVMYHIISLVYFVFICSMVFWLMPIRGHWERADQGDRVPHMVAKLGNYFGDFSGYSECNIRANDLYRPLHQDVSLVSHETYCPRRKDLLEAMSNGGRIGFDAPYFPRDCHYRWYTSAEICMILERFLAVIFVGDSSVHTIYAGLNILLRQDLAHGALRTWTMDKDTLRQCSCDHQFTSTPCLSHFFTSSQEIDTSSTDKQSTGSPYICNRTPHAFLPITTSPAPESTIKKFHTLVPRAKLSSYHPIPIIHSLSPTTATAELATASLEEWISLADASHRKTPLLWLGPTASGHLEIRGRKGNQEIWDFDRQLRRVADDNGAEVLGLWNATVQAESWDGVRFGEKVAITHAMMVVNWLARLESS